jgi:hypothetical protein
MNYPLAAQWHFTYRRIRSYAFATHHSTGRTANGAL